jgi:uncharacterized damage-inducible protein DinB
MELAECRALLGHAEWADALVWKATAQAAQDDAELRGKLHHLHMVQWAYLHVWRREHVRARDLDSFPTLGAIRAWAREYYRALPQYLATLEEDDVRALVRFPWAERLTERYGVARPAAWGESVVQVAMHSSYHRGQVVRRLRELKIEAPLSDFIAWIWLDRPEAEWGSDAAA